MFFFPQYSTQVAHNLPQGGSSVYNSLFSQFESLTVLMKQKESIQKLVREEEKPSRVQTSLFYILDHASNSSCEWVNYVTITAPHTHTHTHTHTSFGTVKD